LEDRLRILLSADERSAEDKLTDTVTVIKALLGGSADLGENSRTPHGLKAVSAEHDITTGYLAHRVATQMKVHKHLFASHWSNAATRAAHEAFRKINSKEHKICCLRNSGSHSPAACKDTLAKAGFQYVVTVGYQSTYKGRGDFQQQNRFNRLGDRERDNTGRRRGARGAVPSAENADNAQHD
jgi:hypothetical protein